MMKNKIAGKQRQALKNMQELENSILFWFKSHLWLYFENFQLIRKRLI